MSVAQSGEKVTLKRNAVRTASGPPDALDEEIDDLEDDAAVDIDDVATSATDEAAEQGDEGGDGDDDTGED